MPDRSTTEPSVPTSPIDAAADPEDAWLDGLIASQMDELFVDLAPGVEGFVRDLGGELELGGVRAKSEGDGQVGRYLDTLPKHRKVVVPHVMSERLEGMLTRRGFRRVRRFDISIGLFDTACWIRDAESSATSGEAGP